MKKAMKKLMAALLAVAMVCAMAIPAWAAPATNGSITVKNTVDGKTYKIYKILDLETNGTGDDASSYTAFKYKATTEWKSFVDSSTYLKSDADGYVTWKDTTENTADIEAFSKAAMKFAANLASDATQVADNSGSVTFTGLELGYYLITSDVDTSSKALCMLSTTKPSATVQEKNGAPTVEKKVEYASGSWGEGNDGNVGDTVNFQTTIYVTDGNPTNYVLHDKMSNGLTFKTDSIVVTKNDAPFIDYTKETPNDGCTFEIKFNKDSLHTNDKVVVTYSATINSNAVVGSDGNDNETWLKYGETGETTHSNTKTYTWKFDILKFFTDSNGDKKYLADVEFVLYRKNADDKAEYAKFDSNNKLTGWTATESEAGKLRTNATSNVTVEGLDEGTYFLKEITTPGGFNGLTTDVEVQIDSSCNTLRGAAYTVKYKMANANDEDFTDAGDEKIVPIENKRGTTLPGTGGIGTTIFYVVGGGLMVAAAILLITKKRMENH